MKKKEDLIELASVTKPHGIKGAFLFKLFNDHESVLTNKSIITIFPTTDASSVPEKGQEYEIDSISFGNKTICYLKDIRDRNIVEKMIPFSVFYPRELFPSPAQGECYIRDLIGLKAIDTAGVEVGVVDFFYDNGAQVVLAIQLKNEKIIELPFVENFFPQVDIEQGKIVMIVPEFE